MGEAGGWEIGVEWAKGGPRKGEGSGDAGGCSYRTVAGEGGVSIKKEGAGKTWTRDFFESMFTCKESRNHLLHSYKTLNKKSDRNRNIEGICIETCTVYK